MRAVVEVHVEEAAVSALRQTGRVELRVGPQRAHAGDALQPGQQPRRVQVFEDHGGEDRVELAQLGVLRLVLPEVVQRVHRVGFGSSGKDGRGCRSHGRMTGRIVAGRGLARLALGAAAEDFGRSGERDRQCGAATEEASTRAGELG